MDRTDYIDSQLEVKADCIDIKDITINDQELRYICSKVHCPTIKEIKLTNSAQSNSLTHQGILGMQGLRWDILTVLNILDNNIADKGCKYLTKAHMPNLHQVSLWGNNVGDAGLLHLSKAQWQKLHKLNVSNEWNEGGDEMRLEGCSHLIRGNWRQLIQLGIGRPDLSWEEAKNVLLCVHLLDSIDVDCGLGGMNSKFVQSVLAAKYPLAKIYPF